MATTGNEDHSAANEQAALTSCPGPGPAQGLLAARGVAPPAADLTNRHCIGMEEVYSQ